MPSSEPGSIAVPTGTARGCRYYFRLGLAALLSLLFAYNCIFPAYISYRLISLRSPVTEDPGVIGDFAYKSVTFTTTDDIDLSGWYIPSRNGAAVIILHGSNGNRTSTALHALMIAGHNYGVLMMDLRGHGDSGGDKFTMGWDSNPDVAAAVTYLQTHEAVNHIGVLGLSMGAEVALQAAAADTRIEAVVSDGAGARTMADYMQIRSGEKWLNLPFIWSQFMAHQLLTGLTPPPGLVDLIPQISPRPVLFIASEKGQWGERLLTDIYYESAGPPKAIWKIADATHTNGLRAHPTEYEQREVTFLDAALLAIEH